MMCPTFLLKFLRSFFQKATSRVPASFYLLASSIATATATVIPTMGLLPAPMRPIISLDKPPLNQKSLDIIRMRHITVSD